MPPSSSRWYAEEACAISARTGIAPSSGARIFVHHKPGRHRRAGDAVEFSGRDGDPQNRSGARRGLPGDPKPLRDTLTMLALMPILEEAGVPAGVCNVSPSRRSGPVVDAMRMIRGCASSPFTGSTPRWAPRLLHSAADQVLKTAMELAATRRSSCSRMPTSTPPLTAR